MYSLFFRQYGRIMHKKTAKAAVLYVFHKVYLMRHAEKSLFSMQKHKKTDDFPRLSSVLLSIRFETPDHTSSVCVMAAFTFRSDQLSLKCNRLPPLFTL